MSVKVVLDTNILVSALVWDKGKPNRILRKCLSKEFTLITSQETLKELEDVLMRERKFNLTRDDVNEYLALLSAHSILVSPIRRVSVVNDDPSDNKFIECALEGGATYIVSGDKHLLAVKEYKGIRMVDCAGFLNITGE